MSTDYPTDTEIHAYIDLELGASRAATIKELAERDQQLAERIRQIRALKEHLSMAYDDFDDEAANEHFSENSSIIINQIKPESKALPYAAVAMLVGGLLIGFLTNQWYNKPKPENWVAQVVSYQDMYTQSTIAAIETKEHDLAATAKELSNVIGQDFTIPDLSAMGLVFKRGQVLQSNNQPVVQLAYLDTATGEPVAVCVTALQQAVYNKLGSMETGKSRSVNYVHWQEQNLDFVVIGRQLPEKLAEFAKSTKEQQLDTHG